MSGSSGPPPPKWDDGASHWDDGSAKWDMKASGAGPGEYRGAPWEKWYEFEYDDSGTHYRTWPGTGEYWRIEP